MSDKEILALYRSGQEQRAFGEIVRTYSERLYWHVRSLVGSHEDTDDLLQEIYIKIWTALPSFRGDSQLFTWIWRIATNETLNFLSRRQGRGTLSLDDLGEAVDRRMDDPYFNGTEVQRQLCKAVVSLPRKQRTVFCMRYYEDLSYGQISEILKTSVGALKASYHFAYNKIKEEMKKNMTD